MKFTKIHLSNHYEVLNCTSFVTTAFILKCQINYLNFEIDELVYYIRIEQWIAAFCHNHFQFKVKFINIYYIDYENNAAKITVFHFLFHLFVEMLFGLHCSLKFGEYAIRKNETPFFYSVLHLIPIQHVIYFVYTNLRRTHMYELVMSVNCNTDWYIFMALVMRLIIISPESLIVPITYS